MKKRWVRPISLILCVLLALSEFPLGVFAAQDNAESNLNTQETETEQENDPAKSLDQELGEDLDLNSSEKLSKDTEESNTDSGSDEPAVLLSFDDSINSEPKSTPRAPQEFPFDSFIQSLIITVSDKTHGERTFTYVQGDPTSIDVGEVDRNASVNTTIKFSINEVLGNDNLINNNPSVLGDTFTCSIPEVLSNATGGSWSGVLKDSTTNYGMTHPGVGTFTIENGKLTISFDEGYLDETKGNIKEASLAFSASIDLYDAEETEIQTKLFYGDVGLNVTFPAIEARRNLTIEKQVERYSSSEFSSYSSGSEGKSALNSTAKVDNDGYLTYTLKVTAAEDNTHTLQNVIISDSFTTDNIDLSSVEVISAVKGVTDISIKDTMTPQYDDQNNLTGWNIGVLKAGDTATIKFKVKIDKDKVTEAVEQAKNIVYSTETAEEARTVNNTATATADKTPTVTAQESTLLQNWLKIQKSTGSYDPSTGRQLFTIKVTSPSDNKYTNKNIYVKDYINSQTDWIVDAGIVSVSVTGADQTVTSGTQESPLYHNLTFAEDNQSYWSAYLDELAPGETAVITAYVDIDTDLFYQKGSGYSYSGINDAYNYAFVGGGPGSFDLKKSTYYSRFSIVKTWVGKSGTYSSDGTVSWTLEGNTPTSKVPQTDITGMVVTDALGSYQEFAEDFVLVTFKDPVTGQIRAYTGDNADENGKLKVSTAGNTFEFTVPQGYGDCSFVISYKTNVTNNFGSEYTYYNYGTVGQWKITAQTKRPRIAAMQKDFVTKGEDWAEWTVKVFGDLGTDTYFEDSLNMVPNYQFYTAEDLGALTMTFNNKAIDPSLYTVTPIETGSPNVYSGFILRFTGEITDVNDQGKIIRPSNSDPLLITYRSHLKKHTYDPNSSGTKYNYTNTIDLYQNGSKIDSGYDYFQMSTRKEISKSKMSQSGSYVTWKIGVNYYGFGCYQEDENGDPVYYTPQRNENKRAYTDNNVCIFTDIIPKGLRFVSLTFDHKNSSSLPDPEAEILECTENADGTTTLRVKVKNLRHYESGRDWGDNSSSNASVDVYYKILTQIVDPEALYDTTGKVFEYQNTAFCTTRDNDVSSSSAKTSFSHTSITKGMQYDGGTAPNALFTLDINPKGYDLNPDGDTVKIYDKCSSTMSVNPESVKITDSDGRAVDFSLDVSKLTDGLIIFIVPDNEPLTASYAATVFGAKDETVTVSNVAYFEGQSEEEVTSRIEKQIRVLNSEASSISDYMIWLNKLDAVGKKLPGATFTLEAYHADTDSWIVMKDDITTVGTGYATRVAGLDHDILYKLFENEAPDGYVLDPTPHYFCLKTDSSVQITLPADLDESQISNCQVAGLINVSNKPYIDVTISKVDSENRPLSGAKFEILDEQNQPVLDENNAPVTFTSGQDISTLRLEMGTYTLVETDPPIGYFAADPIVFTANADKSITINGQKVTDNTIVVEDEPTTVSILKQAITMTENGPETVALEGAFLQILDENNVVVKDFTSGSEAVTVTGVLKAGATYVLHEFSAPDGYLLADDISFTVNEDKTITTDAERGENGELLMTDVKPVLGIVKTASNTKLPLSGVTLALYNEDTLLREWTTDEDPEFFDLDAGKTYRLEETSVPRFYTGFDSFTFVIEPDGSITYTPEEAAEFAVYENGILTVENKYTPDPVDLVLPVAKTFTSDSLARPSKETFTFLMTPAEEDFPMPENNTAQAIDEGEGAFETLHFTEAGTYTYFISEQNDGLPGYSYDDTIKVVTVTVTDESGILKSSYTVEDYTEEDTDDTEETDPLDPPTPPTPPEPPVEPIDPDEPVPPTPPYMGDINLASIMIDNEPIVLGQTIVFTNAYHPVPASLEIEVEKTFTKDSDNRPSNETFKFTLSAKDDSPMPESGKETIDIVGESRAFFGAIEFTMPGTYTYTVTEENTKSSGYTYAEPVTLVVTVTDEMGELKAVISIDDRNVETVTMTNGYHAPESPKEQSKDQTSSEQSQTVTDAEKTKTGENEPIVVWSIMMLIAFAGVSLVLLSKRNRLDLQKK